ncbi:MAG: hypothetical protein KAT15_09705 [Bacteroidales bacterium]|nr:hypothetical protein [Bacteroidales bacterium]
MKATFTRSIMLLLAITMGFEPTSFAQCVSEDNVFSFIYEDKYYEIIKETKTWAEAASCAVERGGYLAEINSQAEQDTIYSAIIHGAAVPVDYTTVTDGGGIAYIWIGASDQHSEGTWLWDGDGDNSGINFWNGQGIAGLNDGVPVDELYNNWGGSTSGSPNEPDNYGAGQDGAAIGLAKWPAGIDFTLGIASEWNDISSDNSLYFVVEFDCINTTNNIDEIACDTYISPSGKTWTISGTYLDTIANAAGCDSVITINLAFHAIDTSVSQDGLSLTANTVGAAYQWLDCNNDKSIIVGETSQSFMGISGGSYAVEIKEHDCIDTSSCHTFPTTGIFNRSLEGQIVAYQGTDNKVFYVDLGDVYQDIVINVSDVNGRLIHKGTFSQTRLLKFTLDEPPGIYFITTIFDHKQAVIKLKKD